MTLIAFQPDAFQWGFQIMDIIPVFTQVPIEREFQQIEAGQAVMVITRIEDIMTTPGLRFLLNPATLPQIQIYKPDGIIYQAFADMVFLDTGIYGFQKQTISTDPKGLYSGQFKAINGTMTGLSETVSLFSVT